MGDGDLSCDACGAAIDGEPLHFSGRLHGAETGHIHLCATCAAPLPRIVVQDGRAITENLPPRVITGRAPIADDARHDPYGCVLTFDGGYWHFMVWDKAAAAGIKAFMPLPPAPAECICGTGDTK